MVEYMKIYKKYPCGLEHKIEFGLFDFAIGELNPNIEICPIHKNKCHKKG